MTTAIEVSPSGAVAVKTEPGDWLVRVNIETGGWGVRVAAEFATVPAVADESDLDELEQLADELRTRAATRQRPAATDPEPGNGEIADDDTDIIAAENFAAGQAVS